MIGSMSQGSPLMGTGMMALVRSVILRFTSFASMLNVRRSMSAKTGLPLWCMMAAALQMMVNAGTMTSSPGPTPAQATAECSVDVPEFTEMAYFTPNFSAKARSKRVFIRPCRLLSTPRSITSAMYLRSLPVNRQACGTRCSA